MIKKLTKLKKLPLALLSLPEHTVGIYAGDNIRVASAFESYQMTVITIINWFKSLIFITQTRRSKFIPSKKLKYFGFNINL